MPKYRDRVEVFGRKNGKIYGGVYTGDGSFGTFGGGIDNDTLIQAGKREFKEESGWTLKNVTKIPIKPHIAPWYREPGDKGGKYEKLYPDGNRTYFLVGDLHQKGKKASGEDGVSRLLNQRLYSTKEINKLLMTKPDQDEITKKRIKHRLKALHKISAYQSHTAAGNILFPGESLKKKVKSIIKKDIGLSYTKGIKIGNKSSQKDWMPK